jgi:hypothetical protein
MPARRDPEHERVFLRRAAALAPLFRDHVQQRLARGEELYGDSWANRPVCDLLAEIAEECVDVAAWAVLADQSLDQRADLNAAERETLAGVLLRAANRGALGYVPIVKARRRLLELEAGDADGC